MRKVREKPIYLPYVPWRGQPGAASCKPETRLPCKFKRSVGAAVSGSQDPRVSRTGPRWYSGLFVNILGSRSAIIFGTADCCAEGQRIVWQNWRPITNE